MNNKRNLSLLIIGHLSGHISGSVLMVKQLIDNLYSRNHISLRVINTFRPPHLTSNWFVNLMVAIKVTGKVLLNLPKSDVVVFLASSPAMTLYGPMLYLITRLFHKPLVLRLLGGALDQEYKALSSPARYLFSKTALASDLFLFETKHLVEYFGQIGTRVRWFPNTRRIVDLPIAQVHNSIICKRFVFLGRVVTEKGIRVILESASYLIPRISVVIFGPLTGNYTSQTIDSEGKGVVRYGGILTPEQVHVELPKYDALILPTFYEGEGYPGVILEAYSHGLPVIATRWRSIPEIVDEDSGILIPPRSAEALAQAMNDLYTNVGFYVRLKQGALKKSKEFSDQLWADQFIKWCAELAEDTVRRRFAYLRIL